MGDIIDIKTGRPTEPAGEHPPEGPEAPPPDQERVDRLEAYLAGLTPEQALKTSEEAPDEPWAPRDLDRVTIEGNRSVSTQPQIAKLVFEEILARAQANGETTSSDERRALNNYTQLHNAYDRIIVRSGLRAADPTWSPRVDAASERIRARKEELVRSTLGEKHAATVDDVERFLDEGWEREDWKTELARRFETIHVPDVYDPQRFLEGAALVQSISIMGADGHPLDEVGDTRTRKEIKEAQEAFAKKEDDPAATTHPDNFFLDRAAEYERKGRDLLAEQQTKITLAFLREKVAARLIERELQAAAPESQP